MITLLLALATFYSNPNEYTYDLLEVNHVYNEYGAHRFTQVVAWDFHPGEKDFISQGWFIVRDIWDKSDKDHEKKFKAAREAELEKIKDLDLKYECAKQWKYKGKYVGHPSLPRKVRTGGYMSIRGKTILKSRCYIETYTQYDRESRDRQRYPYLKRRGFTK